jgi:hypothetical protein
VGELSSKKMAGSFVSLLALVLTAKNWSNPAPNQSPEVVMKKFNLVGVNALGEVQKLSEFVAKFVDPDNNFTITHEIPGVIKLVTIKGSYVLKQQGTLNLFTGECKGHKVQVHLKKVVGWIQFW